MKTFISGQLIWKDLRLYRAVVGMALFFGVLFYIGTPVIYQASSERNRTDLVNLFLASIECGLAATACLSAVIGGMAFAVERRDGTADFVAALPVSRATTIRSKALTTFLLMLLFSLVNLLIVVGVVFVMQTFTIGGFAGPGRLLWLLGNGQWHRNEIYTPGLGVLGCVTFGCFGASWLLSSILKSPTVATVIPLGLTAWLWGWLNINTHNFNESNPTALTPEQVVALARVVAWGVLGVGGLFFIVGVVVQLKRRSP